MSYNYPTFADTTTEISTAGFTFGQGPVPVTAFVRLATIINSYRYIDG